jgi:phage tail-like protein
MAVVGSPRSYFKQHAFTLEIPDVGFAGFQKCSELSAEIAMIEQWEGGALAADKSPGRYKAADITLERGATKDLDLYRWFKLVVDIAQAGGQIDDKYKKTFDLVQRDRDGSELRHWTIVDGWPIKFVAGAWENSADGNVMESVTITMKYFECEDAQQG